MSGMIWKGGFHPPACLGLSLGASKGDAINRASWDKKDPYRLQTDAKRKGRLSTHLSITCLFADNQIFICL